MLSSNSVDGLSSSPRNLVTGELRDPEHYDRDREDTRLSPHQRRQLVWQTRVRSENPEGATVDHERCRYPHAIVWSPLPPITWILPFIGHMGITNRDGVIFDFAGPYCVNRDSMAFGAPTRYLTLDADECQDAKWDEGVAQANCIYERRMHNLCCDNCHSHTARCLNNMAYKGNRTWNMVKLCLWVFFCAKYTGVGGFVKTWGPFLALVTLVIVLDLTL